MDATDNPDRAAGAPLGIGKAAAGAREGDRTRKWRGRLGNRSGRLSVFTLPLVLAALFAALATGCATAGPTDGSASASPGEADIDNGWSPDW